MTDLRKKSDLYQFLTKKKTAQLGGFFTGTVNVHYSTTLIHKSPS